MTTFKDLPRKVRASLLRGYVEKSWRMPWLAEAHAELVATPVADDEAYRDGLALRGALDSLFSADSMSELHRGEADYDALATKLNAKYGEGLCVLTDEEGMPGLRGFTTPPFDTVTTATYEAGGNAEVELRELRAEPPLP